MVRNGANEKLPFPNHTFINVYTEMFLQVLRDYQSLPDVRTLKAHEIKFFYEGLRNELKEHTKPRTK